MEAILTKTQQGAIALLRAATGVVFLTAGLDKWLRAEPFSAAGFLKFGTAGTPYLGTAAEGAVYNPTHDFWVSLAGNASLMPILNWLVVAGEIAIGVALIVGLFTRFASIAGALMMGLFFVATWDFAHGLVNEQLMYGIVTAVLGIVAAGRYYGLDAVLEKAATIRRAPQLRYVMGCPVTGAEAEPPRSHLRQRAFGPAVVISCAAGSRRDVTRGPSCAGPFAMARPMAAPEDEPHRRQGRRSAGRRPTWRLE